METKANVIGWAKIEDFRDSAYGHGRYEMPMTHDDLGDIAESEAAAVALPCGETPSHVWSSDGRWLAEA